MALQANFLGFFGDFRLIIKIINLLLYTAYNSIYWLNLVVKKIKICKKSD